jgi:hypothetical protein
MTPEKTKLTKIEEIRVLAEGSVSTMVLDITGTKKERDRRRIQEIVGKDGLVALWRLFLAYNLPLNYGFSLGVTGGGETDTLHVIPFKLPVPRKPRKSAVAA